MAAGPNGPVERLFFHSGALHWQRASVHSNFEQSGNRVDIWDSVHRGVCGFAIWQGSKEMHLTPLQVPRLSNVFTVSKHKV